MAFPAYSSLLAAADSVDGFVSVGGPPEGYLWVIRQATFTFGAFIYFGKAGWNLASEDTGLFLPLSPNRSGLSFALGYNSTEWQGRYIVPEGSVLWAYTALITGDLRFMGYQLSSSGS